jgi:menaquinone-specific isochorismate synthase
MSIGSGRLLVGWGQREWMSVPPVEAKHPAFYFPDFFLASPKSWFQHADWRDISLDDLLEALEPLSDPVSLPYLWYNPYQPLFRKTFYSLQKKLAKQEIAKAVPYVFESTPFSMSAGQLVRSLVQVLHYARSHSAYIYGFWERKKREGILGATPEILFRFVNEDKACLETMACAATCPIQVDMSALMGDPKELHEHRLVVEGITQSLAPFGRVQVGEMRLLELPRLAHLVTPISVEMEQIPDFNHIVRSLHPTPALGAFPVEKGMEWLQEYQLHIDRRRYGAPVGYLYSNSRVSSCYVAIRNMQWDKEGIFIGAGCGIVGESQLDREWAEIKLKIQAVKEMLAL